MHIRDKRSVSEQVRSGFRIAGFILLTLALMSVLVDSTAFLLGKNSNPGPGHRFIGAAVPAIVGIAVLGLARFIAWKPPEHRSHHSSAKTLGQVAR